MEQTIDPRAYVAVPRFDVRGGVALGRAMLTAAPPAPSGVLARELARLTAAQEALEAAWRPVSADPQASSEKRPADHALDGAWGALHMRLQAWERLPAASHPQVARATAARQALFPDGLLFLTLPFERQWAESQRRLDHIDAMELGADLDVLCGAPFLAEVRTAHAHYGIVLGITKMAPEPTSMPSSVREPFAALRAALSRYLLKLLGTLDEEDPESVRVVRAALRPIDDFRAATAARTARTPRADGDESPTPIATA